MISQRGGVNKVVGIHNAGNECVINSVINMVLNSDYLCNIILDKSKDIDVNALAKSLRTQRGISSKGNPIELYVLLYFSLPNNEERNKALDSLRKYLHAQHGGAMLSPESIIRNIPIQIIYDRVDIMMGESITPKVDAGKCQDVFIELNVSQYISDRSQTNKDQMDFINDLYERILHISKKNYVCTDMLLESYKSDDKQPTHLVYYNIFENKMCSDNLVFTYPYPFLRLSKDIQTLELKDGHYADTHSVTKDNKLIHYTPKVLHYQMFPTELIDALVYTGYNKTVTQTFIGHTVILAQNRLNMLMMYMKYNESLNSLLLRAKQMRYGKKLNKTLQFYENIDKMKKEDRLKEYERIKNRNYNFFQNMFKIEDGSSHYIDPLVYDML